MPAGSMQQGGVTSVLLYSRLGCHGSDPPLARVNGYLWISHNSIVSDLVVHPLSCCDIWHGGDPGAARGAMPPSAAPDERMLVLVPVRGGAPDGLFDLGPGLEAAALERQ